MVINCFVRGKAAWQNSPLLKDIIQVDMNTKCAHTDTLLIPPVRTLRNQYANTVREERSHVKTSTLSSWDEG